MGISPSVLYSHLLVDLRNYVDQDKLLFIEKNPGYMWPGITSREASIVSVLSSFFKKLEVKNQKQNDDKALSKFLFSDTRCGEWKLQLNTSHDEELWGELKSSLYNFYYDKFSPIVSNFDQILDSSRVGPGSSIGGRGGDFYTKMFSSSLSCTSNDLYLVYKHYIRKWPEWANAEIIRYANYGPPHVVEGNRLSFVPKNVDISRTICVEPTLNMFYQLGLAQLLDHRLRSYFGIKLETQQFKNRSLAQKYSETDRGVTLDLSSASDSISYKMLKELLPSSLMNWLEMFRSNYCEIPGRGAHALNMISSMGNGFTFHLETIIFACIIQAAAKVEECKLIYPRGNDLGNFAVFGDDMIYPMEIHRSVIRLLEIAGFLVNSEKTFCEGPFRESCGSDYFLGQNIRGPYLKALESMQDLYVAINQLNLFSARTGIKLPNTVQRLLKEVSFCPVPLEADDSSGIKMPLSMARSSVRHNLNKSVLYSCYEVVPSFVRVYDSYIKVPRGSKSRIFNPSGLFISFLQHSINSCKIGVRHDPPLYRRKRRVCPNWDYTPTVRPYWDGSTGQQWNTAVYFNLFG